MTADFSNSTQTAVAFVEASAGQGEDGVASRGRETEGGWGGTRGGQAAREEATRNKLIDRQGSNANALLLENDDGPRPQFLLDRVEVGEYQCRLLLWSALCLPSVQDD
jgi:hypothetical protein